MTDDEKREIHRLAGEGLSARAIARLVESTHPTIAKILASPPPPLELPAHMARLTPPIEADDAPADDAPAIVQARYLMKEARAALRSAQACGDGQLAQRQTRNAAFLMNVLARLEASEAENQGGFAISLEEVNRTRDSIRERIKSITARGPVRCAKCARELSIFFGTGLTEAELDAGE